MKSIKVFENYHPLFISVFVADGHLIDYMNKRINNKPQEKEILKIFRAVVKALAELHHNDPPIVHRDIKVGVVCVVGFSDRTLGMSVDLVLYLFTVIVSIGENHKVSC